MYAPIALFVYNRAAHTRQTVEALTKNDLAKNSDLIIFSDAAKTEAQAKGVHEVREYIKTITGFKSVSIIERSQNWGLAKSITSGVTQLVHTYGRVIVLEDDLLTAPSFLNFMNTALETYQDNERVMQVGALTLSPPLGVATDAFFLPVTTTWGWATWQRAWQHFSWEPSNLEAAKLDTNWCQLFDLNGTCAFSSMLEDRIAGRNDSWGILWWYAVSRQNGLVVYPAQNLVWNDGFDGSGVHCGNSDLLQQGKASDYLQVRLPTKLEFPSTMRYEPTHLLQLEEFFRSRLASRQIKKNGTDTEIWLKTVVRQLKRRFLNALRRSA